MHTLVGLLDVGVAGTQGAVAVEVLGGQKLAQGVAEAQAHADGYAVHDAVVAHGEAAAGIVAAGEQALDGLEALALHLLAPGNEQARGGHERAAADALAAGVAVEGALLNGPHGLGVAAELGVRTRVAGGVPLLHGGQCVGLHALFHAHEVAELLQGVGAVEELAGGVVALGARADGRLHGGLHVRDGLGVPFLGGEVPRQLVQEHFLPIAAPDKIGSVARLAGSGAAGQKRASEGLVAVALAVLVEPQALNALHGGQRDEGMAAHVAAGGNLHLGADAHAHGDAAAVATGHGRAVLVLAQLVVLAADGVVHGGVAADVAAGQHHGVAIVLVVLTGVGVLGDKAGYLGAVLVVHEAHAGLAEHELGPGGLRLVLGALHGVGHAHGASELAGSHIGGEGALLVLVPVHHRPVERNELVFLLLGVTVDEPVEGLAGAIGELGDQRRLGAAGGVHLVLVHEVDDGVLRNAHPVDLPGGVQMPDVVAERTEGVLGLHLHDHDLLPQLAGATGHGGAGVARAADDDVRVGHAGDGVIGDLRLLAEPAGAEHLAHGLALVARGGCGSPGLGHGRAALGRSVALGGRCRAASGDHAGTGGAHGEYAGPGQEVAAAERNAPAQAVVMMVRHRPIPFPSVSQICTTRFSRDLGSWPPFRRGRNRLCTAQRLPSIPTRW